MKMSQRTDTSAAVFCDVTDCIAAAFRGELSPHWQEAARREIGECLEQGVPDPERWRALRRQLDEAIRSHRQITDEDLARQRLAANGDVLEYFYSGAEYGTGMEIVRVGGTRQTCTAAAYIDRTADNIGETAAQMREHLLLWAGRQGCTLPQGAALMPGAALTEPGRFDSVQAALCYLADALANPGEILC